MPFEPLKTDEKLEQKVKRAPDMDTTMLFGCSSFVFVSVFGYAMAIWPMFVIAETFRTANLLIALAAGMIPTAIFGAIAARKAGLPGACGFLGGAMAAAIFFYLRLEQLMLGLARDDLPKPDYPKSWQWIVPAAWVLAAALIAVVLVPRKEFSDEGNAQGRR